MELRQLRYFVKIADMGSMSRASLALHISQPSLSHQVSQLEEEIGTRLLTRLSSGVRMTAEGEAFYRQAQQVLRQIADMRDVVTAAQAQLTGRVKIAMAHTQAIQYALALILKVRELHPHIELDVFDNTSTDVLQGITSGRRDFGIVINEDDAGLLDSEPIVEEEMFLMSRPDQAPASNPLPRSDLMTMPLALPAADQLSQSQVELLGGRPEDAGRHAPRNWIVANSVAIFRQAVLAGVAHAIQPWGVLREDLVDGRVSATPITPALVRTIYLSCARGSNISQAARAVREILLTVIAEQIAKGNVRGRMVTGD